jgi:23S rRNA (cytidine1920-2'-O)/16S rRNA (cytidine1409-2'-O)-methyltransferase
MKENPERPRDQSTRARPSSSRLDDLLVSRGLAVTRSQAQSLIMAGEVLVSDVVVDKAGKRVPSDARLEVKSRMPYVSRGGLKLEAALKTFAVDPSGWVCADIGASTGGFTDCLLQHGAVRVYAVDVGYGQLAWSLRTDPRVITLERMNIRTLEGLPEPVSLVTVDVSFIGLRLVLPVVATLLALPGQAIVLIKPQFEVGRELVGKGGVVRDPRLHRMAISGVVADAAAAGFETAGLIRSPLTGPAGNVEFLSWLRLGSRNIDPAQLERWLDACTGKG